MIIGITGYAQHGKDTIGDILVRNHGYKKLALADKVREFALAVDPAVEWEGANGIWSSAYLAVVVSAVGWDDAKRVPSVRHLLQRIGTEAGRNILGENVWINALFAEMDGAEDYVITDVRFPNEAGRIVMAGGEVWRVTRPGFDNGVGIEHESERHVATLPVAHEIVNDGGVGKLGLKVAWRLKKMHAGVMKNG